MKTLTQEGKRLRKLARTMRREERLRKRALYERFCTREFGMSLSDLLNLRRTAPLKGVHA